MDITLDSWGENAKEWIKVIENNGIGSRKVTNPALLEFIDKNGEGPYLDLGCGEGWLTRELHSQGKQVMGADGTLDLIRRAKEHIPEMYCHMTFEDVIDGNAPVLGKYATIILNYCLYGDDLTTNLLRALSSHLVDDDSRIIIQTVHPYFLTLSGEYRSRWIENAWSGLPGNFTGAHRWYCRTMMDWTKTAASVGYQIAELRETISEDHKKPLSLLLCLTLR